MKKLLLTCILAVTLGTTSVCAQSQGGHMLSLSIVDPINPEPPNQKSPILVPVLYIDGYTLTAGDNTLGSTIRLLDANDNVVFSTYVSIEGDIELPETLSGTYTIEVVFDNITFAGEIGL